jgi:hypothetical protein
MKESILNANATKSPFLLVVLLCPFLCVPPPWRGIPAVMLDHWIPLTKKGYYVSLISCLKISSLLSFLPSIGPGIWIKWASSLATLCSLLMSWVLSLSVSCPFDAHLSRFQFWGRHLIISVFVSTHMDRIGLSSILNLALVTNVFFRFLDKFFLVIGVFSSQFYRFLRLCSSKESSVAQMATLIALLKEGHICFLQIWPEVCLIN